jgi:hypothetical protein
MMPVKEGESEALRVLRVDGGPCWPSHSAVDAGN